MIKARIFEVLETGKPTDLPSRIFGIFMTVLILLNVFAVILETVEGFAVNGHYFFKMFEIGSVFIFTVEYLLRLWTCTADDRYKRPIIGRFIYSLTVLAIIDLLAIMPFYLPMVIPFDLRFIRTLRLIRLARIFKVGRYFDSLKLIGNVVKSRKEELAVSIAMVLILLIIASGLMYFIENEAQPNAFASIPAAMWWGVATLTTVGYGDMCPVTTAGKLLGAIIALLGIGIFAFPTSCHSISAIQNLYRIDGDFDPYPFVGELKYVCYRKTNPRQPCQRPRIHRPQNRPENSRLLQLGHNPKSTRGEKESFKNGETNPFGRLPPLCLIHGYTSTYTKFARLFGVQEKPKTKPKRSQIYQPMPDICYLFSGRL